MNYKLKKRYSIPNNVDRGIFSPFSPTEKKKIKVSEKKLNLLYLGVYYSGLSNDFESYWISSDGVGIVADIYRGLIGLSTLDKDKKTAQRKISSTKKRLESIIGKLEEIKK